MAQAKIGSWCRPMPAARARRMVTTMSMAEAMVAISMKVMPSSQKSGPMPGEYTLLESGVYMNQPASGASSHSRLLVKISPPNR
jgi:hypothetical protein